MTMTLCFDTVSCLAYNIIKIFNEIFSLKNNGNLTN